MIYSAITIDYETWQPIPRGYIIDWYKDIFDPTLVWIDAAQSYNIPLTFFIDMAELYWLQKYNQKIAYVMEQNIKTIVNSGHTVQLHLHPTWLEVEDIEGHWIGLDRYIPLYTIQYLDEIIYKAKCDLENIVSTEHQKITVSAFRAANFCIQPSEYIMQSLCKSGITIDSSVCPGEFSVNNGIDFRNMHTNHQPYYADCKIITKVNHKSRLLEIPIFTYNSVRWSLDLFVNSMRDKDVLSYMLDPLLSQLYIYGFNIPISLRKKIKLLGKRLTHPFYDEQLFFTSIAHTKVPIKKNILREFFFTLTNDANITCISIDQVKNIYEKNNISTN